MLDSNMQNSPRNKNAAAKRAEDAVGGAKGKSLLGDRFKNK